jgi:hypothetical protein
MGGGSVLLKRCRSSRVLARAAAHQTAWAEAADAYKARGVLFVNAEELV